MHQTINAHQIFWRNCQAGIPAEVILGSPKTPDCKNLGICRIQLERIAFRGDCVNRAAVYLRMDKPTGRLLIHFFTKSVSKDCFDFFFGSGSFTLQEDYILPPEVARALMLHPDDGACRLRKGHYPVLDDDHFLTVSLRLHVAAEVAKRALAA